MEIVELLTDELVRLPKYQPSAKSFKEYIDYLLDAYVEKAKTVKFAPDVNASMILSELKSLTKGIKLSVKSYYSGRPFDAYRKLRDGINQSNVHKYWEGYDLKSARNLYRIRKCDSNYALTRDQLFHIPFHLRGRVSTQRYSIPGFPSLYLSNSIYVAWEEMRRPVLEKVHAARFVNQVPLTLIDLTTSRYLGGYSEMNPINRMIADLVLWPLAAACSVKVKETDDHFKPEYIVPQLLLQWIRNNNIMVHGLKFSSTHIDLNEMNSKGDFFNVVIPVVENKEKGYCNKLSEMFNMTDVLSFPLHQFSFGGQGILHRYSKGKLNPDINRIELIKNKSMPYDFSPFAGLELTLNSMKCQKIDFQKLV